MYFAETRQQPLDTLHLLCLLRTPLEKKGSEKCHGCFYSEARPLRAGIAV